MPCAIAAVARIVARTTHRINVAFADPVCAALADAVAAGDGDLDNAAIIRQYERNQA